MAGARFVAPSSCRVLLLSSTYLRSQRERGRVRDGVERAEAKAQSGERGRSSTPGKEDDGGPNAWREPEDPECLETRESRKSMRLGKAARE